MNILIIGSGEVERQIIDLCLKSKLLDKIYTASFQPLENIPNIEFESFEELTQKAKALQIDIAFVCDKMFIENGLIEFFKNHLLNIISVNNKWFNLENSRIVAKSLLNYYSINNPALIKAPTTFPVVIKTDKPHLTYIAQTMDDLVQKMETLVGKKTFMEEFLDGEIYYLLSLWDGKNTAHFQNEKELSEVQQDRLDLYKTKLNLMLSEENADFLGFFTTKLIWAKNDWYVLDFVMHINEKSDLKRIKSDFLYIANSVIYQKVDEL